VMDFAIAPEGGADDAVMVLAVRLDFEVEVGGHRHRHC
jgi:hypothetical protein